LWRTAGGVLLVALLAVYAVQAATPLRLDSDSIVYLWDARSIATGHGIPHDPRFPPGLPGLYAFLDVIGLGRTWALVLLNAACAAVGIACTIFLYRRALGIERRTSMLLAGAALLSYLLVKHAALPLSDIPYFAAASGALVAFTVAAGSRAPRRWGVLALGLALVGFAITIRTAGIALVPAAIAGGIDAARAGEPLGRWLRRPAAAVTIGCSVLGCAIAGAALSGSRYLHDGSVGYVRSSPGSLVAAHLRNWGEAGLNVPETKLPHALHPLLVPAGVLALAVLLAGIWHERRRLGPVGVFALAHVALVFAYPYEDARLLLPVVPLAIGYGYLALRPLVRHRAGAVVVAAYASAFVLLGVAALGYDTRLTFSGASFPSRYGSNARGATLRPTYRVAFGEAQPGDAALVNSTALVLLRHFDGRTGR
jgi:hypothetical protein